MDDKLNSVKIDFTEEQLNVVLAALQELPYKHAAPVFDSIVKQVQKQVQPVQEVKAE